MVQKLECGSISNVKRVKGNITDCFWAIFHYLGFKINITYDCLTNVLLIHEWYDLPESELTKISDMLQKYFQSLV